MTTNLSSLSAILLFLFFSASSAEQNVRTERISGSAGDVLEDNPVGRLKVYVYELPSKYNKKLLQKDPRCLTHMFAAEIFMHRFLLSSPVRTRNPDEADWFYAPIYPTCDLTPTGLPLPFKSPRMMRSAIQLISSNWPYWNRTEGADHFFVVPHDFGACFHYQEEKAIERGILPLLQRATLVQTFGQRNHVCLDEGSITIPPFAPPQKMQAHLIPPEIPRSIFVYFRGLFYDVNNDPEGGYYARGARAAVWENFKNNPLFDISTDHPTTYYEDMQRSIFCLCPLGWAPWSPRLVEAVVFGCIPVIIADDIVLPFADAIPWEEIGVFVGEKDVPELDTILTSIPTEVILRKQRLLANPSMKRAMLFPQPAQPGDAFHQILNGLARKLPHDRSIYLRAGISLSSNTASSKIGKAAKSKMGRQVYNGLIEGKAQSNQRDPLLCLFSSGEREAAMAGGMGAFWGTRVMEIVKKHDSGGLVWKRIKLTSTRKANAKTRLRRVWQNEAVLRACGTSDASNSPGVSNTESRSSALKK